MVLIPISQNTNETEYFRKLFDYLNNLIWVFYFLFIFSSFLYILYMSSLINICGLPYHSKNFGEFKLFILMWSHFFSMVSTSHALIQ